MRAAAVLYDKRREGGDSQLSQTAHITYSIARSQIERIRTPSRTPKISGRRDNQRLRITTRTKRPISPPNLLTNPRPTSCQQVPPKKTWKNPSPNSREISSARTKDRQGGRHHDRDTPRKLTENKWWWWWWWHTTSAAPSGCAFALGAR